MRAFYHHISIGLGIDEKENVEATFQQVYFDSKAFKSSLISLLPVLFLFLLMMLSLFWYLSKSKHLYFGTRPAQASRQVEIARIHHDLEKLFKNTSLEIVKFKSGAIQFFDKISEVQEQMD